MTVVQQTTDDQPKGLKPALESMTLLVAAVIVHDKAANRVVLLQRSENAKFAQGMWDLPVGKSEPGEPITETAVRELYEETGLAVKPESLKVAHIIHGSWGVEAPNGFLTASPADRRGLDVQQLRDRPLPPGSTSHVLTPAPGSAGRITGGTIRGRFWRKDLAE